MQSNQSIEAFEVTWKRSEFTFTNRSLPSLRVPRSKRIFLQFLIYLCLFFCDSKIQCYYVLLMCTSISKSDERRKGTYKMNETSGLRTWSFLDHHCPDGHWVGGKGLLSIWHPIWEGYDPKKSLPTVANKLGFQWCRSRGNTQRLS